MSHLVNTQESSNLLSNLASMASSILISLLRLSHSKEHIILLDLFGDMNSPIKNKKQNM